MARSVGTLTQRVVTRYRVAARAAGYYGWDPPEEADELEAPKDDWDSVLEVFTHALRQRIGKPEESRDRNSQTQTVSLTGGFDLSDEYLIEASVFVEVSVTAGVDADDEGEFNYHNESTSYELTLGRQTWKAAGPRYSKSRLENDFKQWSKACYMVNAKAARGLGLRK